MEIDRRQFAGFLSAAAALGVAKQGASSDSSQQPLFVATWNFGLSACKQSLETLNKTKSILDAIEMGIRVAEADTSVDSVGVGGAPNAHGVVQLDACFMDGETHKAGSVAALENYPHPISVARRVMEKTKHVLLVGSGAAEFAKKQGFEAKDILTSEQKKKWEKWLAEQAKTARAADNAAPPNHDTIALVGMDATGHIAGGCSTSGLAYKMPGRVGDSPILGSGLYVDGEIGAAGATGIGENVMRHCGSFLIVEFMRSGMEPTAACRAAIERIAKTEKKKPADLHINFLAIDKQGRWGAAGTDQGYEIAVVTPDSARLEKPFLVV
ncbi:MAG: N(4)-(beta-N-acetylglucosaminyl)-L-asparaginase [Planctomycetota bacterium]|nr:N(4)-(beta-N-acetylglucosaminyl)-L-asparaginase [Planctomycetota bacterium]